VKKKFVVLSLALISIIFLAVHAMAGEYKPSDITKVVMLGSGTPIPDPNRGGPCIAVVVNDKAYIVDAGANCVRRIATASSEYGGSIDALNPETLMLYLLLICTLIIL